MDAKIAMIIYKDGKFCRPKNNVLNQTKVGKSTK